MGVALRDAAPMAGVAPILQGRPLLARAPGRASREAPAAHPFAETAGPHHGLPHGRRRAIGGETQNVTLRLP